MIKKILLVATCNLLNNKSYNILSLKKREFLVSKHALNNVEHEL